MLDNSVKTDDNKNTICSQDKRCLSSSSMKTRSKMQAVRNVHDSMKENHSELEVSPSHTETHEITSKNSQKNNNIAIPKQKKSKKAKNKHLYKNDKSVEHNAKEISMSNTRFQEQLQSSKVNKRNAKIGVVSVVSLKEPNNVTMNNKSFKHNSTQISPQLQVVANNSEGCRRDIEDGDEYLNTEKINHSRSKISNKSELKANQRNSSDLERSRKRNKLNEILEKITQTSLGEASSYKSSNHVFINENYNKSKLSLKSPQTEELKSAIKSAGKKLVTRRSIRFSQPW